MSRIGIRIVYVSRVVYTYVVSGIEVRGGHNPKRMYMRQVHRTATRTLIGGSERIYIADEPVPDCIGGYH